MKRKGSRRRSDIPAEIRDGLNRGTMEAATLAEGLAIDFQVLLSHAAPELPVSSIAAVKATDGVKTRMEVAGRVLFDQYGVLGFERFSRHSSDTVRGWAAYLLVAAEMPLEQRMERIQGLADDPHFGVREWAWLAIRNHVAADIRRSIQLLKPWVKHRSENVRRFAVEVTRPRGVWCSHIAELKAVPELGLPLLSPLHADPTKYVQDSVSNWLNDAAKSNPDWVRALCQKWLDENRSDATNRICQRAIRSVKG